MSRWYRDSNYVIIKEDKDEFFPHGGDRRSEVHWNDTRNKLNTRRFRVDPLKDGWDPQEDPIRFRHRGTRTKKGRIPIQPNNKSYIPHPLWRTQK